MRGLEQLSGPEIALNVALWLWDQHISRTIFLWRQYAHSNLKCGVY